MRISNHQMRRTGLQIALVAALCGASLGTACAADNAGAPAVRPGDDFFQYVNGEWLASHEIPADKSSWSTGSAVGEETNRRIVKLIEAAGADKAAKGEARQVADFYAAYMDEAGIESRGVAPLQPSLAKIAAIRDKAALVRALAGTLRADVDPLNATNFDTENILGLWVTLDMNDPRHALPYLLQGGLGMPDRAYYVDESERMARLRAQYLAHIAATLKLAGFDDPDARAARVMALETKLARRHGMREDSEDVLKANNTWTLADFKAKAPGMDWPAFFKAAGLRDQKRFIVWQPGGISGAAALVASEDLATWQDYLRFHLVNHFSGELPKAFVDEHFAFNETALSGTPQLSDRWKRGLAATSGALGEPVSHLYVATYFTPDQKQHVREMVTNIVAAFRQRIDKLDWMAPATRAEAKAKLASLYVGIGYPDQWRPWAGLKVSPTDALGNAMRGEQFHYAQQVAKLHAPVDRSEWSMSSTEINAVNMPLQNALNFPAAILQPPFFDPKASDASNYGRIGGVIGHEISHSFDDQGAEFDSHGRLRNWWTPEDSAHFKTATAALVAQYSAYQPYPDLALNGQQTLSENLADLAGVGAAYDAYVASLHGKPATRDDDRAFFTAFATNWCSKSREARERKQIIGDGHSPSRYRASTVRNLDAWYRAFDVQPGQALYLAPKDRVRVW
jgi:endothelin-converting enzyme/putative endopeptidase